MKYQIDFTTQFKRDLKSIRKQGKDESKLREVISMLASGEDLPDKYRDHALRGKYDGYRDCHIEPDWVLIYMKRDDVLVLLLTRTGSHAELFK